MIPLCEARRLIAAVAQPLAPVALALERVHGRVLRENIVAPEDIPAFDRSAMDGYAVGSEDVSVRFRVAGESTPGKMPAFSIGVGECARIFTGAPLPPGASRVIMQEDAKCAEGWMTPLRKTEQIHVRHRGEDARRGALLLKSGVRIGPGEASLLAQVGVPLAQCSPSPRVLHVATGSELVAPATMPGPGQIRDTNSTLIAGLLREQGAELARQERCGDDLAGLVREIADFPPDGWDLLLISGGASVGDYDFGKRALAELGFQVHFDKINLRPGKPLVFASRGRQLAFVIPGNPVSHFVVFHVAIRAALEALEAADASWPMVEAQMLGEWKMRSDPRESYWPGRLELDGLLAVRPLVWQSSGDLCGLVGANALIQVADGAPAPAEGRVRCLLLKEA